MKLSEMINCNVVQKLQKKLEMHQSH